MGFNNVESMMLGLPAYFYALAPSLISARIADSVKGARAWVIVFNAVCIIAGTAMYSQLDKSMKAARFAGIFLAVGGGNSNVPLIVSWQGTSIRAQSKRAFCSAVTVAFGGVGGILGSALFMNKEARIGFPTGVFTTLALNALTVVIAISLHYYYGSQNKKADRGELVIGDHEDFRYQN
jgi:hypothetical protein